MKSSLIRSLIHVTVLESHRGKEFPPISERHMPTVPTQEKEGEEENTRKLPRDSAVRFVYKQPRKLLHKKLCRNKAANSWRGWVGSWGRGEPLATRWRCRLTAASLNRLLLSFQSLLNAFLPLCSLVHSTAENFSYKIRFYLFIYLLVHWYFTGCPEVTMSQLSEFQSISTQSIPSAAVQYIHNV